MVARTYIDFTYLNWCRKEFSQTFTWSGCHETTKTEKAKTQKNMLSCADNAITHSQQRKKKLFSVALFLYHCDLVAR